MQNIVILKFVIHLFVLQAWFLVTLETSWDSGFWKLKLDFLADKVEGEPLGDLIASFNREGTLLPL